MEFGSLEQYALYFQLFQSISRTPRKDTVSFLDIELQVKTGIKITHTFSAHHLHYIYICTVH